MGFSEIQWDRLLKIKTTGSDDTNATQYRYPYEPTSYDVLELLGNSGYIRKQNTILDYGCGKGRVGFFLSYQTRCKSIGIEYNERIYQMAKGNKETAVIGQKTEFILADASIYEVPEEVDRCYFFNPFSIEVFRKTYARILESYYRKPREILLLFYYIQDAYLDYLMEQGELRFLDEIDCAGLIGADIKREKIKIFSLGC